MHFAPRITLLDREDSAAASDFNIVAMRSDAEDLEAQSARGVPNVSASNAPSS